MSTTHKKLTNENLKKMIKVKLKRIVKLKYLPKQNLDLERNFCKLYRGNLLISIF